MIYGYARVSTVKQASKGNSLEEQRKALTEAGALEVVSDAYTGTKMDRPNFTALLDKLEAGDTLIVTKLDRFARTADEGHRIVKGLMDRGIKVNILNMGIIDNTPIGNLTVHVLLAFAEFERERIVERTQSGKAAREKGVRVDGRPMKFTEPQRKHAEELLKAGNSYNQVASMTGISKSTLIRMMNQIKAKQE